MNVAANRPISRNVGGVTHCVTHWRPSGNRAARREFSPSPTRAWAKSLADLPCDSPSKRRDRPPTIRYRTIRSYPIVAPIPSSTGSSRGSPSARSTSGAGGSAPRARS